MMVLAKHGPDDWRLYHNDGTQIDSSVSDRPNAVTMADMLNNEYPSNSILATADAREAYTYIVTGNVIFVNVDAGQTLPWNQ